MLSLIKVLGNIFNKVVKDYLSSNFEPNTEAATGGVL